MPCLNIVRVPLTHHYRCTHSTAETPGCNEFQISYTCASFKTIRPYPQFKTQILYLCANINCAEALHCLHWQQNVCQSGLHLIVHHFTDLPQRFIIVHIQLSVLKIKKTRLAKHPFTAETTQSLTCMNYGFNFVTSLNLIPRRQVHFFYYVPHSEEKNDLLYKGICYIITSNKRSVQWVERQTSRQDVEGSSHVGHLCR